MKTALNTYWNCKGKFQDLSEKLNLLVPAQGEVPDKKKNHHLEIFRSASNAYYDLYNNGLCNRKAEFLKSFQIPPSSYKIGTYKFRPELYDLAE